MKKNIIHKSTFNGVEEENHVMKTYKTRWISEKDMRKNDKLI